MLKNPHKKQPHVSFPDREISPAPSSASRHLMLLNEFMECGPGDIEPAADDFVRQSLVQHGMYLGGVFEEDGHLRTEADFAA